MVPNDDLVQYFSHSGPGLTKAMGKICNVLMTDVTSVIQLQKEFLPKKSKKSEFPKVIWIEAPLHNNFSNNQDRIKFNKALNDIVLFHDDMFALKLKKIWNPHDASLYSAEFRRYTAEFYAAYWTAIDCTVKFADTILFKKKPQLRKHGVPLSTLLRW